MQATDLGEPDAAGLWCRDTLNARRTFGWWLVMGCAVGDGGRNAAAAPAVVAFYTALVQEMAKLAGYRVSCSRLVCLCSIAQLVHRSPRGENLAGGPPESIDKSVLRELICDYTGKEVVE